MAGGSAEETPQGSGYTTPPNVLDHIFGVPNQMSVYTSLLSLPPLLLFSHS